MSDHSYERPVASCHRAPDLDSGAEHHVLGLVQDLAPGEPLDGLAEIAEVRLALLLGGCCVGDLAGAVGVGELADELDAAVAGLALCDGEQLGAVCQAEPERLVDGLLGVVRRGRRPPRVAPGRAS